MIADEMMTLEQLIWTLPTYQKIELFNLEGNDTLCKFYEGNPTDLYEYALGNTQGNYPEGIKLTTIVSHIVPTGKCLEVYVAVNDIRY